MRKIVFFLAIMWVSFVQAQDIITRNLENFNEVKVFNKLDITLIKSKENRVEITGIKRKEVVVKQIGNLLKIRMSLDNIWDNDHSTKVTVYYNQINKIDVNEGAKVKVQGVLKAKNLDIRVQEGAIMKATIDANYIFAKAITGGEIKAKGKVNEQEIVINAGGQYYGNGLVSKNTQVKISAGGLAEVFAKNYCKANTNAGGTVKIYGNPREMDTQKLLGGKIIEVN